MYYNIKPKPNFHGRTLKNWYRIVRLAVGLGATLPPDWSRRPSVPVPESRLVLVLDRLKKGIKVWYL